MLLIMHQLESLLDCKNVDQNYDKRVNRFLDEFDGR